VATRNIVAGSPARGKKGLAKALLGNKNKDSSIVHVFTEQKSISNRGGM
jgi:hypothetical protein